MKTINTSIAAYVNLNGSINEKNAFNDKVSMKLAELFWINSTKNNIKNILNSENNKEVNSMEEELSNKFKNILWMNDLSRKMNALNNKNKAPLSLNWVMSQFEEYEESVA